MRQMKGDFRENKGQTSISADKSDRIHQSIPMEKKNSLSLLGNEKTNQRRNLIAFWLFGVCNNFAYCLMNSAAQDILDKKSERNSSEEQCVPEITHRHCSVYSVSLVLFCNILPGLIIKLFYPFLAPWISYSTRHLLTCLLLAASLVTVALADSVPLALFGVSIGAVQTGLGEATYLGLSSYYSKNTISLWSTGTGISGILGSLSYAGLTDPKLLGFSSSQAMMISLIVPAIFVISFYFILERPESFDKEEEEEIEEKEPSQSFQEKFEIIKQLKQYMIPLFIVYLSEYFINQGLAELVIFNCSHGFATSLRSQYKWYQTAYQIGVFVSRSSVNIVQFNVKWCIILSILQCFNMVFFFFASIYSFIPHFGIVICIIFYEGLIGGASYVNIYMNVHRKASRTKHKRQKIQIDPSIREFAFAVVTVVDTAGIVVASLASMPVHNAICSIPF